MSHDRHQDPATSENLHPADITSSSTLQFVAPTPPVGAQIWENEALDRYTTQLLERLEPASYADNSFAPVSPSNDISWSQWTYPLLSQTPKTSGHTLSERWIDPEHFHHRFSNNVSLDELSPWTPDVSHISNHVGSSNTGDPQEVWTMQGSLSCLSTDVTLEPLLPTLRDRIEKDTLENATSRDASTWSLTPSLLPEVRSSEPSLPEAQEVLLCELCDASFVGNHRRGNLGRHKRLKHVSVEFPCEEGRCERIFRRKDARLKHYRKHHPWMAGGPPVPRGPRFGYWLDPRKRGAESEFSVITPTLPTADRSRHMEAAPSPDTTMLSGIQPETSHENGDSVQCDICRKTFGRAAELRRHNMSFHDSNTPEFYCEVPGCPRGIEPFARKDKLRDHMDKIHAPPTTTETSEAGEENMQITYSCPEDGCDKIFDHRSDLLRHQRTHTAKSERKHKCLQCDESFLYPKDLKRHEATHLNDGDKDKPSFYCEVASCEYGPGSQGFSRKDALLRHIKNLHPD
jgi:uncharacterized C2H2 Zn-finger protein